MHAVIFDIDGTLLQSASVDDELYRQSLCSILGPVKFRPTLAAYRFVTDSGILAEVCEDNSIMTTPSQHGRIVEYFVELLASHIRTHGPFREVSGAKKLLDQLRVSETHRVAIATGGWRESAELKLRTAGFDLTGIPLASSTDSHSRTEIMTIALQRLGRRFESVSYFGDGVWDRDACQSLGWKFHPVGRDLSGIGSFDELTFT